MLPQTKVYEPAGYSVPLSDYAIGKDARKGDRGLRIGGSTVGVAIGVSDYNTPEHLLQKEVFMTKEDLEEDPDSKSAYYKKRGNRCEPHIRLHYIKMTGFDVEKDLYFISKEYPDFLGVEPDGCIFEWRDGKRVLVGVLEIKTPANRVYDHIHRDHMAQMQWEMYLTGAGFCDYVAMFVDPNLGDLDYTDPFPHMYAQRVYRNELYIKWMLERVLRFIDALDRADTARRLGERFVWQNEVPLAVFAEKGVNVEQLSKKQRDKLNAEILADIKAKKRPPHVFCLPLVDVLFKDRSRIDDNKKRIIQETVMRFHEECQDIEIEEREQKRTKT